MQIAKRISEIRSIVKSWKKQDERIVFVPTMGNLHAGHLEAVKLAHKHGSKVLVSIFVNPLQFGESEDYSRYPRTPEKDIEMLIDARTDALFTPITTEIYPAGHQVVTRVEVPGYSDILCGSFRPGHFVGVATVVTKLFNIVSPDSVILGNKDYQQQLVIKRLVTDLNMPIDIIGLTTVRETDGLAMSSRNRYLSPEERKKAPLLFEILGDTLTAIKNGEHNFAMLEQHAIKILSEQHFATDYFAIRNAIDLSEPDCCTKHLVVLVAARLGETRLIDNMEIILP